jgi:hypothetical protein
MGATICDGTAGQRGAGFAPTDMTDTSGGSMKFIRARLIRSHIDAAPMGEGVSGVNDAPDTKWQRSPLPLLPWEVIRRLRKIFLLQLPLGLMPKHVVLTFRSSRLFPKLTGANSDLLLGRDCHGVFPQGRIGFSSIMTSDTSGSSARLHWQGSAAPHVRPNSSCQARSGWFSQTQPMPKCATDPEKYGGRASSTSTALVR